MIPLSFSSHFIINGGSNGGGNYRCPQLFSSTHRRHVGRRFPVFRCNHSVFGAGVACFCCHTWNFSISNALQRPSRVLHSRHSELNLHFGPLINLLRILFYHRCYCLYFECWLGLHLRGFSIFRFDCMWILNSVWVDWAPNCYNWGLIVLGLKFN